jgi:hypothetical protein
MNTANRVILVVLFLIVIALCTFILIVPVPALNAFSTTASNLARSLESMPWYVLLPVGLFAALVIDIVLALLIYLELRRPSKAIRVAKAAGGEVELDMASVADRLRHELCALPGILSCTTHLSSQRKGIAVRVNVETVPDVTVPDKSAEILETARRVLEEDLGLKLARPVKASLHIASPHKIGAPAPQPPVLQAAPPSAEEQH